MVRASHLAEPTSEEEDPGTSEETEEGEACRAIRVQAAKVKLPPGGKVTATRTPLPDCPAPLAQPVNGGPNPELTQVLGKIGNMLEALVPQTAGQAGAQPGAGLNGSPPTPQPPGRPWLPGPQKPNHRLCFLCRAEGHFARECPSRILVTPAAPQANQNTGNQGVDHIGPHPNERRLPHPAPGQSQE